MTSRPGLRGPVRIASTAVIGEHCTLGYPKEARLAAAAGGERDVTAGRPVTIGERCLLFNHVVIYEGVQIGHDCVIEDRARIGYDSTIGSRSRIAYGAYLCDRVTIGSETRIAGFICDGTIIGDRSTVMGELVHEYTNPHRGWWEVDEAPPVIGDDAVVGYGARVIGGVTVASNSYVAAGATVTRDVPGRHVVTGVNVQTPAEHWGGDRLQDLIRHWASPHEPARPSAEQLPVSER